MHEDFKSRGSDEYMSENEEEPDDDQIEGAWGDLAGMRH